eukprot:3529315-Amphidinium_carterae.1
MAGGSHLPVEAPELSPKKKGRRKGGKSKGKSKGGKGHSIPTSVGSVRKVTKSSCASVLLDDADSKDSKHAASTASGSSGTVTVLGPKGKKSRGHMNEQIEKAREYVSLIKLERVLDEGAFGREVWQGSQTHTAAIKNNPKLAEDTDMEALRAHLELATLAQELLPFLSRKSRGRAMCECPCHTNEELFAIDHPSVGVEVHHPDPEKPLTQQVRQSKVAKLVDGNVEFLSNIRGHLVRELAREYTELDDFLKVVCPVPCADEIRFNPCEPTLATARLSDLETAATAMKLIVERIIKYLKEGAESAERMQKLCSAFCKWYGEAPEDVSAGLQVCLDELYEMGAFFLAMFDVSVLDEHEAAVTGMRDAKDGSRQLVKSTLRSSKWWSDLEIDARKTSQAERALGPKVTEALTRLSNREVGAEEHVLQQLPVFLDSLRSGSRDRLLNGLRGYLEEKFGAESKKGHPGNSHGMKALVHFLDKVVVLAPGVEEFKSLREKIVAARKAAEDAQLKAVAIAAVKGVDVKNVSLEQAKEFISAADERGLNTIIELAGAGNSRNNVIAVSLDLADRLVARGLEEENTAAEEELGIASQLARIVETSHSNHKRAAEVMLKYKLVESCVSVRASMKEFANSEDVEEQTICLKNASTGFAAMVTMQKSVLENASEKPSWMDDVNDLSTSTADIAKEVMEKRLEACKEKMDSTSQGAPDGTSWKAKLSETSVWKDIVAAAEHLMSTPFATELNDKLKLGRAEISHLCVRVGGDRVERRVKTCLCCLSPE